MIVMQTYCDIVHINNISSEREVACIGLKSTTLDHIRQWFTTLTTHLAEANEVNVADVVIMWSENVLCRFVLVVAYIDLVSKSSNALIPLFN